MRIQQYYYILLFSLFLSCQEAPKEVIESWENGTDKKVRLSEKEFSYETNYYQGGTIESEGIIKEEKKEKEWTYFYSDGKIKQKLFYRAGKPFDKGSYFYENGNLKTKAEYDDSGLKSGYWENYFPSGKNLLNGNYSQGEKVGEWSSFNQEGGLEKQEGFDNIGRLEYLSIYNDVGALVRHSEYYKPSGLKLEYYQMDSIPNKIFYRSYFKNGNVEAEGAKLNSHEVGEWTYWYQNGVKKARGSFVENIDEFKFKDVVEVNPEKESKLPLQRSSTGIKIKKWTYWNKEGKKVAEIESKIKGDKIIDKILYFDRNLME